MNTKKLWYWITTAWVVGIMTITGGLSVTHAKTMMEGFVLFWCRAWQESKSGPTLDLQSSSSPTAS
jgi:hypothetical protein